MVVGGSSLDIERFRYNVSAETHDSFEYGIGFGPFTVERRALRDEILRKASPMKSVHISGCKGAGKTTLLELIGDDLVRNEKKVYFFVNSVDIDNCRDGIERILNNKEEAYFLIDETQENVNSPIFTLLLKNRMSHRVTTIGAGVPAFQTASHSFARKITPDRLFLTSDDVCREGVYDFFAANVTDAFIRGHIEGLLEAIRVYVGGHIYPMMRLAELLVPKLTTEGYTTDRTISYMNSAEFRSSLQFEDLAARVTPALEDVNVRTLFYPREYRFGPELLKLQKRGFCDQNGNVISMLLFDLYLGGLMTANSCSLTSLSTGVTGVQQLLCWAAPRMSWKQYEAHGGPVEDALTFELLWNLLDAKPLEVMLFNPKLVTAGTTARRPDIYFNSVVHSYVECVLTKGNTPSSRQDVENHILRFVAQENAETAQYEIQNADFAILHFQDWGTAPMQLQNEICRQNFNERVFTFVMTTRELFLGDTRIACP